MRTQWNGKGRWLATAATAALVALAAPAADAMLISVDFGTVVTGATGSPSPVMSGNETAATAAHPGFGAANVWNGLALAEYDRPAVLNPSFGGLLDSTGAATGVGLSLTGAIKGFSGFNNPSPDPLRKDYLFFNISANPGTSRDWQITGLVAGSAYDLFVYGGNGGDRRDWTMRVDNGGAADQLVDGAGGTAYFASLVADASGQITGSALAVGAREVDWAGFQLRSVPPAAVPEPAALTLLGAGLLGLGAAAHRRRRD